MTFSLVLNWKSDEIIQNKGKHADINAGKNVYSDRPQHKCIWATDTTVFAGGAGQKTKAHAVTLGF